MSWIIYSNLPEELDWDCFVRNIKTILFFYYFLIESMSIDLNSSVLFDSCRTLIIFTCIFMLLFFFSYFSNSVLVFLFFYSSLFPRLSLFSFTSSYLLLPFWLLLTTLFFFFHFTSYSQQVRQHRPRLTIIHIWGIIPLFDHVRARDAYTKNWRRSDRMLTWFFSFSKKLLFDWVYISLAIPRR